APSIWNVPMEIHFCQCTLAEIVCDWLVIGWAADADPGPQVVALDEALSGQLSQLRENGDLQGKLEDVLIDPHVPEIAARRLCVVGLGPSDRFDRAALQRAMGAAALAISKNQPGSVTCALPELDTSLSAQTMAETVVCGLMVGCVGPGLYRAEPDRHPFTSITVAAAADRNTGELQRGI